MLTYYMVNKTKRRLPMLKKTVFSMHYPKKTL